MAVVEVPRQSWGRDKYQVGSLRKGRSMFIPCERAKWPTVSRAVHQHAKRRGKKFACRVWSEDGVEGLKIWRVE